MQAENRRKLHSPGPDRPHGQGAHPMCHSCGWTFPNPHPSAKQRRAHRKHCGKIEGFPLASPRDGGGSNGNDPGDDDDAAALVTPAAPPGGKLSDAHSHPHIEPMCSLDALDRPAMEEGNVDSTCGTGEAGTEILESVGFHGHEALIGIHPGNSKDSSEATSVPGDDKDLKLPDLLHDKEIQRVDAVNVVVQSENGNQLQGPTAYAYTSDMKRERLAVDSTDNEQSSTLLTTTSPLHCPVNKMCSEMDQHPVNKMCSEMDQCVLDEFSVEMKAVREEMSGERSKLYLESPPIKLTESNDSMDAEPKSLKMSNFVEIDVLSNLTITSGMETGVPGTAVTVNLKEVMSELFHVQEMDNNEVGENELANAPTLMKVDTADCQGTSLDPGKDGKQRNVFDNNMKEKEGDYALSACQIAQDAYEDSISDINHEAWLCHEQVASPLPANHESVLKPEDSLGDPDFGHVQSESMLTESNKEDTVRIHHKVCKYQRQAAPISLETIIAEAESVPDCNIDPGLIEMQSECAPVEASEICSGFISSGWPCWNNLELKSKGNDNIANASDENENKTDGINEVKYQIVKKGESDLSIENIQGTEDSSEQMAFPVAMKDQSLSNLIRVVQGPVTSSDHVEGNAECCSGNKVSFPDLACQSTPECVTVEDSGTFGSSNLFTEANEGKVESCIAVTSTSESNQDDARFHHEARMETMNPASEADISDVKSPQYHDLGDDKMQRNKEITECHRESLAVTDGDSQPCIHGFIHLEAWIDLSVCEDSNQKEVECGKPVVQIETEPRSYITEEKHGSDVELHNNELSKESVVTHMSPALCLSKLIIDDTSSNMESMPSMSSLNLHQESSQNAVRESSAESAGDDVDFDIAAAETCIQNKPNETHDTVSEKPDQEGKLNQNSEAQLSHQSIEIPAAEDMVLPPDMLLGIRSSDIEPLNFSGEITSSICLKSDEQADVEIDKDDGRYSPQVLNETVSPESASYIYVKSLHYQDLEENKLHTDDESTESVAVSSESSRPCPPIGMGSENHGSIPLEAWIDYGTCTDSNQTELEGSQLTMHIETEPRSYVTEEQHPDVGFGKNELDKQPELAHLSSISDTSRSFIDDSFSNLQSMSCMSDLTFDQTISQNEINKNSRDSAGDGDHDCVVRETHFQIKPSDTHTTVSEKTDDEKKLSQNSGELLSQHSVEMPTEENMISSPDMLSGIQSSISLEETNRNGKVACSSSICHQSDKHADHLTLNQEDPAAPSSQDALMDTMSQTDSIEVHWGSVSVLSASEAIDSLQDFDTEAPQDVNTRRSGGLHETSLMKRAVSGEKCTEIADLSDAPFPLDDGSQVPVEVGSLQGTQQSSSCTANGVSPSHRDAICESKARKKKEEIIAKIENWSSGKQHTPLKTLLVEANNESRQKTSHAPLHKSPPKSTRSQAPQDEGFTRGTPAPIAEHSADISARKEAQKEWNSPARLPSNRNDKRKVKGKPHWVPFLCCPSLG